MSDTVNVTTSCIRITLLSSVVGIVTYSIYYSMLRDYTQVVIDARV